MPSEVVTFTLRFPKEVCADVDQAATRHGFSRNEFFLHLFWNWRDYKALDATERVFLMHLTFWGIQNFRDGKPDVKRLSGVSRISPEGVRELIDRFVSKGWMEQRPMGASNQFNYDVIIDRKVYGLTDAGLRVAGFAR